jgi:hypothetical protein
MSSKSKYALPLGDPTWQIEVPQSTVFSWEYDESRPELLELYSKGKRLQWNAEQRIDWQQELHPDNPMELPDDQISLYDSPLWHKLSPAQKSDLRRHTQAWNLSQFLHGEQGALIAAAKIVQQVESLDAKSYAATQVVDEARHIEIFSRLLHEKFQLMYPLTQPLRTLIGSVINHKEWDFIYLGIQVVIEGLALAGFQTIRDKAKNRLAGQVNAYIMQDEARHVAFGRMALREYYPQLSESQRKEREEFVVESSYMMRDRMKPADVWEALGLDVKECTAIHDASPNVQRWSSRLFSRIVPTVKHIGLWGPQVRRAYEDMGVMRYADVDTAAQFEADVNFATSFDLSGIKLNLSPAR